MDEETIRDQDKIYNKFMDDYKNGRLRSGTNIALWKDMDTLLDTMYKKIRQLKLNDVQTTVYDNGIKTYETRVKQIEKNPCDFMLDRRDVYTKVNSREYVLSQHVLSLDEVRNYAKNGHTNYGGSTFAKDSRAQIIMSEDFRSSNYKHFDYHVDLNKFAECFEYIENNKK